MKVAEYRRAQTTITRRVVAAAVAVLRALAGQPLTPGQWRALLDAVFPNLVQGRRASFDLAVAFYTAQRGDPAGLPDLVLPSYDRAALHQLLTRTARPRLADPDTARVAITTTAGALVRHVEQAGRDTIITASERDPLTVRWARVPTGPRPCAFCWMLASRGPVYRPQTGKDHEAREWHDSCACVAVPVFDLDDWDGRDTYLTAQQLWRNATAGYSGRDALNAFRRALYARPLTP